MRPAHPALARQPPARSAAARGPGNSSSNPGGLSPLVRKASPPPRRQTRRQTPPARALPPTAPLSPDALPGPPPVRLLIAGAGAPRHDRPGHPECAARADAIEKGLITAGLCPDALPGLVARLDAPPPPDPAALARVHGPTYLAALEARISSMPRGTGETLSLDADTYAGPGSWDAAVGAAGAACALVDAAVAGRTAALAASTTSPPSLPVVGFGITRPPGHHAGPGGPMGFCLLSTAAIAAKHALAAHSQSVRRVLIIDWDVHHGNGYVCAACVCVCVCACVCVCERERKEREREGGAPAFDPLSTSPPPPPPPPFFSTEDATAADPAILFISTHKAGAFPGTGKVGDVGTGDGEGTVINVPLPADAGRAALLAAFDTLIAPAAARFSPDLVLVSAGYDGHWADTLQTGFQATSGTYHTLSARVAELAAGLAPPGSPPLPLVFLLEGGYNTSALSESVNESLRALLGAPSADAFDASVLRDEPADKVRAVLAEARRVHGL